MTPKKIPPKKKSIASYKTNPRKSTSGKDTSSLPNKAQDQQYKQVAAQLAAIVHSSSDAIYSMTIEGIITSWNAAAEKLFGYTEREALGQHVSFIMPKERRMEFKAAMGRILKGEVIPTFETTRHNKSGKKIPVTVTASPIKGPNGGIIGLSSVARDISARKEYEQLHKLHTTIYRGISDAVMTTTPELKILTWNIGAEKITGYSAAEIVGKSHPERILKTVYIDGSTQEDIRQSMLATGEWSGEASIVMKNKTIAHLLVTISAMHDEAGVFCGAVTLARDITELIQARKDLEDYKSRLELAQQAGNIGIYEWNLKTNKIWRNTEQEKLFGLKEGAVAIDNLFMKKRVHPEDSAQINSQFARSIAEKSPFEGEFRIIHDDGSVHWIYGLGRPTFDTKGVPLQMIGVNLNIDERKKTERMLAFKAEASKILAKSLDPEATFANIGHLAVPEIADWFVVDIFDDKGEMKRVTIAHKDPKKINWAEKIQKLFPYDPEAPHGLARVIRTGQPEFIPYIPREVIETASDEQRRALRIIDLTSIMRLPLIVKNRCIGAMEFFLAESKRRFNDADFQMAQELAASASVAIERSQLYHELKNEQSRLTNLVSDLPSIIWESYVRQDPDYQHVDFVNEYILRMTGYSIEEWHSTPNFWLTITHPDDQPRVKKETKAIFDTGGRGISRFRCIKKNGNIIHVEAQSYTIKDAKGTAIGMRGIISDITERTEIERRKDEFISMASHELKTPVTSVKLFTEILKKVLKEKNETESLRYVESMHEQIEKLTRLIGDLLDVSKIQAGKLELATSDFPIHELVRETADTVQFISNSHEIIIDIQVQSNHTVHADRERIGQVLLNLLTNAIKYSPRSKNITITISERENETIVSVKDYGIGIAKQHQDKIFERFYRVYDMMDKTYPGLGMGLFISSEIMRMHGGRMWVESSTGNGSVFYFSIPH